MKNRGLLIALLAVIILVAGYFVWKNYKQETSDKKIFKIGVILPLTGDAAVYGKAMKNGIELAIENSKLKDKISLLFQDDKGETKSSISAGQFLLTQNVDAIIGGAQSKTADVLIPLIKKNKIPLVSPGASSIDFDTISNYFFRLWPSDSYDGRILADFIAKEREVKKVAVFYTNSKYGKGIQEVFNEEFKSNGGEIVYSEPFEEGGSNYRSQLLRIKQSEAEALFLPGYIVEVEKIVKQIVEIGLDIEIYGTSSFKDESLSKLVENTDLDTYYSYPSFSIHNQDSTILKFVDKYHKKFGQNPDVFAANAYDCLEVLIETIRNKASNSEQIQQQLLTIQNYSGVSGLFSFDNQGNVVKEFEIFKLNENSKISIKKKP